ncbi:hypothetical protein OVY01_22465 [Robbsia sp. Bb-Pol-6]|uniref:Uncharacterized protein n=1 Tax=Robbsia betulipollinis TaxID=2981849 RepID=A0ABT3ZTM5_9BURK|nr:hypothetical protein [Robbsia betulipollinis]MCY0389906.1 hypothetical protein [Robbsia betulipollinis]
METTLVSDLLDLENAWHNLKNKSIIVTDACRASIEATGKALDAFKEANDEAISAVVAKTDGQGSRNLPHVRKRPASALGRAVLQDSSKTTSMLNASNALDVLIEAHTAWASLRDRLAYERTLGRIEARFFDVPDEYETGLLIVQQDTDKRMELKNLRETTLQTARKLESDVPEPIKVVATSTAAFDLDSAPPPVKRVRAGPVVAVAAPTPVPAPAVEVPPTPVEPLRVSRVDLETGEVLNEENVFVEPVHEASSIEAPAKPFGLAVPSWVLPAGVTTVAVVVCVAGFMLGHKPPAPVVAPPVAAVVAPAASSVAPASQVAAPAPALVPHADLTGRAWHVEPASALPAVHAATPAQHPAPHSARVTHEAVVYNRLTAHDQAQVKDASKAIDSFFAHHQ